MTRTKSAGSPNRAPWHERAARSCSTWSRAQTRTPGSGPAAVRPESVPTAGNSSRRAWPRRATPSTPTGRRPTCTCSFCAAARPATRVEYTVARVFDGRTAAARRVDSHQAGRLLTTATVSFAAELPGPEHGHRPDMPGDPDLLPRTGPAGPAPSMPLDELDIRIADDTSTGEFVRRLWWRATVALPDDPAVHTLVAVTSPTST